MTTNAIQLELSFLTGSKFRDEDCNNSTSSLIVEYFLDGKYECILDTSEIANKLFRAQTDNATKCIGNFIKKTMKRLLEDQCEDSQTRDMEVLALGASCLHLFIQNNWHGPASEKDPLSFCHTSFQNRSKDVLSKVLEDLALDGDETYEKSRHVTYLYMARMIFLEGRSNFSHLQTWDWWLMRCLMLQQTLLRERSPTLKSTVLEIIDNLDKKEPLMTNDLFRDVQILFHLEAGHATYKYLEFRKANDHFNIAQKISGLDIDLSGAMGKRTQFQRDDKAQLYLKVSRKDEQDNKDCMFDIPSGVPKILPLDDDTVLNSINFTDDSVSSTPKLSPFEHVLILGVMENHRRSVAHEKLTTEEILTYIEYILHHSTNWNVITVALHLRSRLERDSRRRVERSMMQLEILSNMTSAASSQSGDVNIRAPLFFASHSSPSWEIKRDYATVLMSLGLIGEALDVFESLEMWEDVIACYQRMRKTEKAESLIRERLAIKETPTLYCFLGDVTGNIDHYKKAWDLSGHRNSRSQRCMGYLHFNSQEFEKAIECFTKSLEINPLQIPLWFTCGCAAMASERYELGVTAFKRCVTIDYDNFEAWSNLATCYVRLKEKVKAYSVLQDALKCNYDNWRLWENSLVIGIDVGEFKDVIRSYHRLIDLKKKWVDVEILNILTRAVTEKIPDSKGRPADHLHGDLMKLFGRVTSAVTGEGEIWSNYANLSMMKAGDREPDLDVTLQHLQKANRCFSQKVDWEKDVESCKKVAKEAVRLTETYISCSEGKPQQTGLQLLSASKLQLRGALVKVQKQHTDPITQELSSEVSGICALMDTLLQDLVARIAKLKTE